MPAHAEPTGFTLTPAAVKVVRRFASHFQSARVPGRVGYAVVALELGYGGKHSDPEGAKRVFVERLRAGTFQPDIWARLAFLIYQTNDHAWAQLRTALDLDTWARTVDEVETLRHRRPFAPDRDEPMPGPVRTGRPVKSHVARPAL